MKASEAMRKGWEGHYQVKHVFADGKGGLCALGAIMVGSGYADQYGFLGTMDLVKHFPVLSMEVNHWYPLYSHIAAFNNQGHGPEECIAEMEKWEAIYEQQAKAETPR